MNSHQVLEVICIIISIIILIRVFAVGFSRVCSGSMEPTLTPGDVIFVNKLAFSLRIPFTTLHVLKWNEPKRGDVITFRDPWSLKTYIKRVIGLPGESVEMKDNFLKINGIPVNYDVSGENSAVEKLFGHAHNVISKKIPSKRTFDPVFVNKDSYFVMGDNRDESLDSRFIGCIPRNRLIGRAKAIIGSVIKDAKIHAIT